MMMMEMMMNEKKPVRLTNDEREAMRSLSKAAQLPWPIRATLWGLYPVSLTRGRLVAALLFAGAWGSLSTIAVRAVFNAAS